VDETNLILEAIGNLPYVRVYALVEKIQAQASEQLAAQTDNAVHAPGAHIAHQNGSAP
jgi:hypothetical protein